MMPLSLVHDNHTNDDDFDKFLKDERRLAVAWSLLLVLLYGAVLFFAALSLSTFFLHYTTWGNISLMILVASALVFLSVIIFVVVSLSYRLRRIRGGSANRSLGSDPGHPSLNPLRAQFLSSLDGLEITTSADRQLIRGHNLVGAVRLQFVKPSYFDDETGEHGEVLDGVNGIDIQLSMHFYPYPQID